MAESAGSSPTRVPAASCLRRTTRSSSQPSPPASPRPAIQATATARRCPTSGVVVARHHRRGSVRRCSGAPRCELDRTSQRALLRSTGKIATAVSPTGATRASSHAADPPRTMLLTGTLFVLATPPLRSTSSPWCRPSTTTSRAGLGDRAGHPRARRVAGGAVRDRLRRGADGQVQHGDAGDGGRAARRARVVDDGSRRSSCPPSSCWRTGARAAGCTRASSTSRSS